MTVLAAVLAPSRHGAGITEAVGAALACGADEVLAVVVVAELAGAVPEGATVLLDDAPAADEASCGRVAIDWAARNGHDAVVVAHGGELRRSPSARVAAAWAALVEAPAGGVPVLVGVRRGQPAGLVRLEAPSWALLPLSGPLAVLWQARPELAGQLDLTRLLG